MPKTSYLIALLGILFVLAGCSPCGSDVHFERFIATESEFEAVAQCESISGYLWIENQHGITNIDLPELESVEGRMVISENGDLTSIGMPGLISVGALTIYNNDVLATIDMRSLMFVDGDLSIHDNACLSQAEAEALAASADVHESTDVADNGSRYPCN